MDHSDDNIVDFNSKRLEKQEIMNADFNDKLIEEIQNLIFTKCVERGYPISSEDERFISDVTIGCNIIRQTIDKLSGVANDFTQDIDDIREDSDWVDHKDPRQLELDI